MKIRYSNFDTEMKQARIPYTASSTTLTEKALELFRKVYTRRMMLRLIGIKFTDLIHGTYQIDLFSNTIKDVSLNAAMDSIRKRFGFDFVKKAITEEYAGKRS